MNQQKFIVEEEKRIKQNTVFTKDTSNKIVEKVKVQKFSMLFNLLDPDSNGSISA